jgi:hypothetical protein
MSVCVESHIMGIAVRMCLLISLPRLKSILLRSHPVNALC